MVFAKTLLNSNECFCGIPWGPAGKSSHLKQSGKVTAEENGGTGSIFLSLGNLLFPVSKGWYLGKCSSDKF